MIPDIDIFREIPYTTFANNIFCINLTTGLYWFRRGFCNRDSHLQTVTAYQNGKLKYKRRR